MFLAYASSRKIKVYQMDIKSAFLNGELDEVYIEQLEGFVLIEKKYYVCKLNKVLYALKQAPRVWYARLDRYLQQQGFKKGSADNDLYVRIEHDSLVIIEVYVDDIIFGSDDDKLSKKFAANMQSEFKMSLLGCKLSIDDSSKDADQRMYRSMIGSLLYVTISKPYVMQIVRHLARFQATPKESYVIVVKIIFRYLKGTSEYGLWYPKGNELAIATYTNADWARSVDDRKSTSGANFYLGGCLVSWLSKKQSSISLSTTEAKYIAVTACCTQVLWMKQTLQDIQVKSDETIPIFCDNTNAISISKNPVMHSKTKDILIKYHFVREQVAEMNIKVEYIGTKEQIADIFTKPLLCEIFEYLRQKLGIPPSPQ
eukprot:PITA_36705